MTAVDWLGLLGVIMVGGSILIAFTALTFAIVADVRRGLELRDRRRPRSSFPDLDPDAELGRILAPHARRAGLRVIEGGGGSEGGAAA